MPILIGRYGEFILMLCDFAIKEKDRLFQGNSFKEEYTVRSDNFRLNII
jgi:hypothetical protein